MTPIARFGPVVHPGSSSVTFRLWAPAARRVEVLRDGAHLMQAREDGWHELTLARAGPGTVYKFRIDGEIDVPDPASHFQPEDVHGPSEVIDHAYAWRAPHWRGRPWEETVLLELHIGSFTPQGTFRSAIGKLDHVAETGFTAIELMPIADFPGRWNWGYDGVFWYAPDARYGRPDDLRALIDAAHERGLMVFLDVVYNHFGPEGNYLGRYATSFFSTAHTPWGHGIDYRVPQVRAFAIESALHWLRHYRFDGLRLDAVHAIVEPGAPSLLTELSRAAGALERETGRIVHLVLENDANEPNLLDPLADPPEGEYRAQWNDDYHHAWHGLLTGERGGYYRDYVRDPGKHVARVLASGFAYQGEASVHRKGRPRGGPSGALPTTAFVNFLQNHDQIGNRPHGDRLAALTSGRALRAALAVTLLAPMPPMMFMGEEWGSTQPFPFFCDFSGHLADAVRRGRKAEFASYPAAVRDDLPDPVAEATFRSAVLDWAQAERAEHRALLALVHDLLRVRAAEIVPRLRQLAISNRTASFEGGVLRANFRGTASSLALLANLSDAEAARPAGFAAANLVWGDLPGATLPPWSVFWAVEDA
jgi:malto-oligosyltrehalose trehalohydrolase